MAETIGVFLIFFATGFALGWILAAEREWHKGYTAGCADTRRAYDRYKAW